MKWHLWTHYCDAIRAFGEVAIYACDTWEHLHIFYAKTSFKATNGRTSSLVDQARPYCDVSCWWIAGALLGDCWGERLGADISLWGQADRSTHSDAALYYRYTQATLAIVAGYAYGDHNSLSSAGLQMVNSVNRRLAANDMEVSFGQPCHGGRSEGCGPVSHVQCSV